MSRIRLRLELLLNLHTYEGKAELLLNFQGHRRQLEFVANPITISQTSLRYSSP